MQLGESSGDPADHVEVDGVAGHQSVHHALGGQALHVHGVLDGLTFATDAVAIAVARDRHDAEVDAAGTTAAVEHDLLLAGLATLSQGPKSTKPRSTGFLSL